MKGGLPTYQELAELLAELTEINVAGLDTGGPGTHSFVRCFTYGAGKTPKHWKRAIAVREALIKSRIIKRQKRCA